MATQVPAYGMKSIYTLITCAITAAMVTVAASAATDSVLYVRGRYITTPCGDTVLLRGVNNMHGWKAGEEHIFFTLPEIASTGANVVRIVWQADPGFGNTAADLDDVLEECGRLGMIAMPELHDATSQWALLQSCVDYWCRPEIMSVLLRHEKFLMLNIANEVGTYDVTDEQFRAGYGLAVTRLRDAGLACPLVIDAAGYGQGFSYLINNHRQLQGADPLHNLVFDIHTYYEGVADAASIVEKGLQDAVDDGMPIIVGEFAGATLALPEPNVDNPLYLTVLEVCHRLRIGWMAWEWYPGNNYNGTMLTKMDMTGDGTVATLKAGWARNVMIDDPRGVLRTSVRPAWLAGGCQPTGIPDEGSTPQPSVLADARGIMIRYDGSEPMNLYVTDLLGRQLRHTVAYGSCIIPWDGTIHGMVAVTVRVAGRLSTTMLLGAGY